MSTPESAADVLDRELANTQRAGIVTAAAIAVASAGALDVIGALQLWSVVWLFGVYQYVPHALLALGAFSCFWIAHLQPEPARVAGGDRAGRAGPDRDGGVGGADVEGRVPVAAGCADAARVAGGGDPGGDGLGACARTAAARKRAAAAGSTSIFDRVRQRGKAGVTIVSPARRADST